MVAEKLVIHRALEKKDNGVTVLCSSKEDIPRAKNHPNPSVVPNGFHLVAIRSNKCITIQRV